MFNTLKTPPKQGIIHKKCKHLLLKTRQYTLSIINKITFAFAKGIGVIHFLELKCSSHMFVCKLCTRVNITKF